MPTYEYHCTDCSESFSLEASMDEYDEGLAPACPACESQAVERRIGNVVISTGGAPDDASAAGGRCTPGSGCC
jgi:putative FmdB family regulatory protein